MRKFYVLFLAMVLAMGMTAFSGCSKEEPFTSEDTVLFNLSDEEAEDLQFKVEVEGAESIDRLDVNGLHVTDGYSMEDGVITVSADYLKSVMAGLKTLKFTFDNVEQVAEYHVFVTNRVITTPQEFDDIRKNPAMTYVLGADIDCSEIENFVPFPEFYGTLEGNGYTVSNINIDYMQLRDTHDGNQFGVFQTLGASAVIRNITFKNCMVKALAIAGVVCGVSNGATYENVAVVDSYVSVQTGYYDEWCNVAGVAGMMVGGTVNDCLVYGTAVLAVGTTNGAVELDDGTMMEYGPMPDIQYAFVGRALGHFWDCVVSSMNERCEKYLEEDEIGDTTFAGFGSLNYRRGQASDKGCVMVHPSEMVGSTLYEEREWNTNIWVYNENSIPSMKQYLKV